MRGYKPIAGVEVAYFCDVDENVLNKRCADAETMGMTKPQTYTDFRKLIADKNVDAVSIATPNHWHSLMGIWAAQAGKDIYCEKPCSHNWWEGRQLVRAMDKYKVICEHGSQCRSSVAIREAMDQMQSGLIGNVYMARGLCYKWRDTIGRAMPEAIPAGVHYDLWTGPAPMKPFTKNRFHYNWHWIWDTGNGDLGNQGIHELDLARWGLGVELPIKVTAIGGHFLFDDDQETPNTITAIYEFRTPEGKTKMMNFEVRGWMTNHEAEIGTPQFEGGDVPAAGITAAARNRNRSDPLQASLRRLAIFTTGQKGIWRFRITARTNRSSVRTTSRVQQKEAPVRNEHFVNFIECMRSRKAEDLHAPIREGYLSTTLVHLANASYRLGRTIHLDPQTEMVVGDAEATAMLKGTYRAPFVVPESV